MPEPTRGEVLVGRRLQHHRYPCSDPREHIPLYQVRHRILEDRDGFTHLTVRVRGDVTPPVLGLGNLYRRTGDVATAQEQLMTAATLYREMGMGFWLEKAETAL